MEQRSSLVDPKNAMPKEDYMMHENLLITQLDMVVRAGTTENLTFDEAQEFKVINLDQMLSQLHELGLSNPACSPGASKQLICQ